MNSPDGSTIAEYFENEAEEFADLYLTRPAFKERYRVFEKHVVEILRRAEAARCLCLDIGCGDGIFSRLVAKQGCRVIGIDNSINMINLAKERAKKENLSDLTNYIHSSFPENLETFHRRCDLVIASSVLEYVADITDVLVEINRLMRQNGFLLASLPNHWSVYRFFERHVKSHLLDKDSYLSYQKHQFSVSKFRNITSECGFKYILHEYFGAPNFLYKLIPNYRNFLLGNLFLMVLQKAPESSEKIS